jgi:hypothetical protein
LYEDLGIKVYSYNFQGQRYLRDKRYFSSIKVIAKFLFKFFFLKMQRFDYVLARTEPNIIGFLLFKIFPKSKKIYFPYDISLFRYENPQKKRTKLDIISEKYCFKNADYILHKGPKDEIEWIKKREKYPISGKDIQFLPFCFDQWIMPFKTNKEKLKNLHLVYIGGLYYNYKDSTKILLSDPRYKLQWFELFKLFSKQKIHIHAYSLDPVKDISNKYIHLYRSLPDKKLNSKLGIYKYGINIFFHNKENFDKRWWRAALSNKIFSYLEAGIPFIVNDELEFMANIIRKFKCGIVISEKDLPNLRKILEKQNYKKLLEGVKKAREHFRISKQIKILIDELEILKNKSYIV